MKNIIIIALINVLVFSRCEKKDHSWNLPKTNELDSVNKLNSTNKNLPALTTSGIVSITQTSAQSGGNITNNGGAVITSSGVCYSTSSNPTTSNNLVNSGVAIGSFTTYLTGLSADTKYYVRAFATNSVGTSYGNELSFTTNNISLNRPSLTTLPVSSIAQTSAQSGGNITNNGGAVITASGACYSTSSNPTTSNNLVNSGVAIGSFTTYLTGLSANTKYYVRAFATNSVGTSYGNELSFNLLPSGSCNITKSTNSTSYSMQTPSQSIFKQNDSYTITMYNSTYSFGQASSVDLFDNDVLVYNFGTFIYFASNSRTFTLPTSISSSNCYNIRVSQGSSIYVSPPFTIIP